MENKKQRDWVRLIMLAFPIIVNNIVAQVQMLIDKMFLGRLELTCTSAVGNATSPMWTTMSTVFALTLGGTILISQAIGAKETDKAKNIMASVFRYNNYVAGFWFLFWMFGAPLIFKLMKVDDSVIDMSIEYARYFAPVFLVTGLNSAISSMLQVSEKTRILIAYGILRSGLNILLDYLLIFGSWGFPRMEVAGAALATTIAEYSGLLFIIVYVVRKKNLLVKPSFREIFTAKWCHYFSAIKVGIPAALEEFTWNLGNLFLIVMLNNVSATAAGIYSIVFSVELLPIAVVNALGQATVTLSGQEAGRKNYKGLRSIVNVAFLTCLVLGILNLAGFIVFPESIMGIFTNNKAVIAAATVYLMIVGVDLFPKSANNIIGSGIRAYGNTKWMLLTQICGTLFVITGSALLVLGLHKGITALFWLVVADETLRCSLNFWKLRKDTSQTGSAAANEALKKSAQSA